MYVRVQLRLYSSVAHCSFIGLFQAVDTPDPYQGGVKVGESSGSEGKKSGGCC